MADKNREVYVYQVPKEISAEITSVGMRALTTEEELNAWKRSGGEQARLANELVMASVCEVAGKPVGLADGTVDSFWKECPPVLRQLVLSAYGEIHTPKEAAVKVFLASRQVRVG